MKSSAMRTIQMSMLPLILPLAFVTSGLAGTTTCLPFINDNYSKAAAQAQQRRLPIFVDVWAPW